MHVGIVSPARGIGKLRSSSIWVNDTALVFRNHDRHPLQRGDAGLGSMPSCTTAKPTARRACPPARPVPALAALDADPNDHRAADQPEFPGGLADADLVAQVSSRSFLGLAEIV